MGYEIDFLPVGDGERSGDAIALRFGNLFGPRSEQTVAIVDGGFRASGEALVEHVQAYYKTDRVDLVVSTHPDIDHASGLQVVLDALQVDELWMHKPWEQGGDISRLFEDGRVTDTSVRERLRKSLNTARELMDLAEEKGIPVVEPFSGLAHRSQAIIVVGPSREFYQSLLPAFLEPKAQPGVLRKIKDVVYGMFETFHIETLDDSGETSAQNNSSVVLLIGVDEDRYILLTGDAGLPALTDVANRLDTTTFDYAKLKLIQIPHHGSKRNVGPTILDRLIGPKLSSKQTLRHAYVSASADSPKHPARKVTNAFLRRGAPVTSTEGGTKRLHHNAPDRGWRKSEPLPFYDYVEE